MATPAAHAGFMLFPLIRERCVSHRGGSPRMIFEGSREIISVPQITIPNINLLRTPIQSS